MTIFQRNIYGEHTKWCDVLEVNIEDHRIGIRTVVECLQKEEFEIVELDDKMWSHPQIVALKDNQLIYVNVYTSRLEARSLSQEDCSELFLHAAQRNAHAYFAPVTLIPAGASDEEGFFVGYHGMNRIENPVKQ